jgi:formylglycine-generating enzyme required for sulfatase activity
MGSDFGQEDERPVHEVSLDPYSIAAYTVTNREYRQFLQDAHRDSDPPWMHSTHFDQDIQPVVGVSWFEAANYCEWLSRITNKPYRLPTEAEWEFAACAGLPENIYPWGKRDWNDLPELHSRFQHGPEPVQSFSPNSLGIYDLGINVHEWCSDWYQSDYYSKSDKRNPRGPNSGTRRSSRGGSWRHAIKITRCSARSSIPPHMKYADYGFRIARPL